ncbi:MAG: iron-containing alcohol dehydrogenase [Deltaproteobacteria bacterium]|nr:iron-containing alcohol dehydrogenase [Deltaproteobacteria bacterium]
MKATFQFPTRILFGQKVIEDLPDELKSLHGWSALVVTDKGLVKAGIVSRVVEVIKTAGMKAEVFDEVSANPTGEQVEAGALAFKAARADCIVGLGGGSSMDAAKAIQLRIHHHEPLRVYDDLLGGDCKITGSLPPLAAVPTTSGTGSEVSRSAVVTLRDVGRKVVIFSPRLMPHVAVCDPELTYGLPGRITAETGMDAFSHSLEALVSKGYHPMADGIALRGIRMVAKNLPIAVTEPKNAKARQEMMMASTMGAVAFQKGLGVIHSLAHALGAVVGVSHGLANALIMPHAIRFNAKAAPGPLADVAAALGVTGKQNGDSAAEAVEALLKRIGLIDGLAQAGVTEEHVPSIVEKAMEDGCHTQNPRPVTPQDMEAILRATM